MTPGNWEMDSTAFWRSLCNITHRGHSYIFHFGEHHDDLVVLCIVPDLSNCLGNL